ncbi:hypothetical protein [Thalassotalea marina]|uniref:Sugar transporter SemiSWEET n=1 Tax=Thalassotalea marina TaxID=1673741 RepID=A0A919BBI6_9GAMM|nr:hypothetical protein [Thalassotalea marina]GHF79316.1 hypothetical protein GCM10017161_03110 [Thalassotalea marina]
MSNNSIQTQEMLEKRWDLAGIIIGLLGCVAQLTQVLNEWQRDTPSGLSIGFVSGYWLVFAFWLSYGLFFKRSAIIITNAIALLLQTILLISLF